MSRSGKQEPLSSSGKQEPLSPSGKQEPLSRSSTGFIDNQGFLGGDVICAAANHMVIKISRAYDASMLFYFFHSTKDPKVITLKSTSQNLKAICKRIFEVFIVLFFPFCSPYISGDSKKTFRNLRVNILITVQFKTIKLCICLQYDVIMMWYKFHNHTPNIQRMAGHSKLQLKFCNIIDSSRQTVWSHR
jgi:hypothetical protein